MTIDKITYRVAGKTIIYSDQDGRVLRKSAIGRAYTHAVIDDQRNKVRNFCGSAELAGREISAACSRAERCSADYLEWAKQLRVLPIGHCAEIPGQQAIL